MFLTVDILGAVFSLISLAFREKFDWLVAVFYLGVVVLDLLIILLFFILNRCLQKERKVTVEEGTTIKAEEEAGVH